jgi:hypothetical protein
MAGPAIAVKNLSRRFALVDIDLRTRRRGRKDETAGGNETDHRHNAAKH